jgi:hypothetical protein
MTSETLKHSVDFIPGHDCISFECRWGKKSCIPGKDGSHGRGGLTVRFVTRGSKGAIQFVLYTGWTPQYIEKDCIGCRYFKVDGDFVMPADLGYHSKAPRYDGQTISQESCEYCDGEPCYYDGSGLQAYDAMYALVNGGDAALWAFLDARYFSVFYGTPYPEPAEYPTAPRQE